MSFSTLLDIEACPRRWGLKNATYGKFEEASGYPTKPNASAIQGLVIHGVLEDIVKHAARGVEKNFGARVIQILRERGGLSRIVEGHIETVVGRYSKNPRATYLREVIQRQPEFHAQVRASVQKTLRGLAELPIAAKKGSVSDRAGSTSRPQSPLRGMHSEVALHGPSDWYGKADLIVIDSESVRIEDFKSGKPKDDDAQQLKIYAWLFWRDQKCNPTRRVPNKLVLRYLGDVEEVPTPSVEDLEQLERDMLERTAAVREQINNSELPARVSEENCSFCPVRQMCDPYWVKNTIAAGSSFFDVQVEILRVLSPRTWSVFVQRGCDQLESDNVSLVGSMPDLNVSAGDIVRALGVRVSFPDVDAPDDAATIRLVQSSEVFFVGST